jgi:hypothetical protein
MDIPNSMVQVVVAVGVILLIGVGLMLLMRGRQRSKELRERFGPEYERTVEAIGNQRKAEQELATRQERVASLEIRPLSAEERARFAEAWRSTQARFVDAPNETIGEANKLIKEVMQARGYPVNGFEERAADLSVHYPEVVTNYRAAYRIAQQNERHEADTEDLRQAMVHYRSLFEELLDIRQEELLKERV